VKTAEVDEQKTKYLQHFINKRLCAIFSWSREYNGAKEICKYPSFSKVGGKYPLDLKIIWSSALGTKQQYTALCM
jgi:hypothetical protein